jgi:hypothetical protein
MTITTSTIRIMTPTSTFNVLIKLNDTVGNLKRTINNEQQIPLAGMNLFLNGQKLANENFSLLDYQVTQGSTLDLLVYVN